MTVLIFATMRGTLVLAVLFALFVGARSWDSMDLQMFDLIEEVKMNFYDYLGIDKVRVRLFLIGYIRLQPVMMSGERIEDCPYLCIRIKISAIRPRRQSFDNLSVYTKF